ncbi:MAG: YigZ family protein [Erysipelotrichaceae bacterium]|nr:YigZ family protein [Erysipelotrichaceae bacterium]
MYRIQADCVSEIEIKKSRFITYLHKTTSEADARTFIQAIKKQHPNATHHCYAYVIGEHNEMQRNNDDGEPGGTAGMPMMECLLRKEMQDIAAVTVRYFGGIKLGAGGLIRAYAHSVSQALSQAVLTKKVHMKKCSLSFSYDLIGKMDHFFRSEHMEILDKSYEDMVTYVFVCKDIPFQALSKISSGSYLPEFMEEIIIDSEI